MSSVTLNRFFSVFFCAGIVMSLAIPYVFYKSFNSIKTIEIPEANSGSDGLIYHIDECSVHEGKVVVRGWASPIEGYGRNLVFVKTDKGSISLRTSIQTRTDVSAVMKKPGLYDKSGYFASIKLPSGAEVGSVVITTMKEGKVFDVEANCVQ